MAPLPLSATASLKARLDQTCAGTDSRKANSLPGIVTVVVNKSGREIFTHASGNRGLDLHEPMTTEMRGQISLDDAAEVTRLCPELMDLRVLCDGNLEEKKRGITLRMLLTHTAGFGYSFTNHALRDYGQPAGYDEFSGCFADFMQPLVNQPGDVFEYGISMDWAGIVLERQTGQSLGQYMEENIFRPLGLTNISMLPSKEMKAKLAYMHQRTPDGRLTTRDHLLRRALTVTETDDNSFFHSGGAGCFSTASDYARDEDEYAEADLGKGVLTVLLNNGTCPKTGIHVLHKETVDQMFTNQISHLPPLSGTSISAAKAELTNPGEGLYPCTTPEDTQGWGLDFLLSGGARGRSMGSAQWSGLPNLRWWVDREKGVAGIIAMQVLPFGDLEAFILAEEVEGGVYEGLRMQT